MEEIDRFQVPPVNGETQPLVREKGAKTKTRRNARSPHSHSYKYKAILRGTVFVVVLSR